MTGAIPAGWPADLPPPGAAGWERRAIAWLYDLCPPDHRGYAVLTRWPVLLARVAGENVAAAIEACRHGAATARADLRELAGGLPPEAVDQLLALYEQEALKLQRAARGVEVVAKALAGQRFVPRL